MALCAIGIAVLASAATAFSGAAASPTGVRAGHVQEGLYEGTGRACSGTLRISQKRLTWRTPFSQCSAPAALIESRSEGDATRWTYRLGKPQGQCFYKVVMIEKIEAPGAPVAWNVLGYPSVEAQQADAKDGRLACYLIKAR